MKTVPLLEQALRARAIVFGSLPPRGRDVDLLIGSTDSIHLARVLEESGFIRRGGAFFSFEGCPPEIVELVPAESWDLPADEQGELFEEAIPLPGCARLARPAPHHALLVLARRVVRAGVLSDRFRKRVDSALTESPGAFARARVRSAAWGCERSIDLLEWAYRAGIQPTRRERAAAIAAELRTRGRGPARVAEGTVRALVERPRLGSVIALSGLDGSGKSTQARLLAQSLDRLGYESALEWPAIDAPSRVLATVTKLTKGAIRKAATRSGGTGAGPSDPARALRQRSEILTFAWSGLYAVRGAGRVARSTWPHVLRGRIVICDRYLLDTHVFLLHRYGAGRRYGAQLALVRLLSPRPRAAFLLDVSPASATARQPERTLAENIERASLYRTLASPLGVEGIDGELAQEEVCADLARRAWLALQ